MRTTSHLSRIGLPLAVLGLALTGCAGNDGSAGPVVTPLETTTPSSVVTPDPTGSPAASTSDPAATPSPAGTQDATPALDAIEVAVFWANGDATALVQRPRTVRPTHPDDLPHELAIGALLAGPTSDEQAADLTTQIPTGTQLLDVRAAGDAAIVVDVSGGIESGGGSAAILGRLAQLTWTATQSDQVDRVFLEVDGEPVDVFSGAGVSIGDGMTRDDFPDWAPGTDGPQLPDDGVAPVWDQSQIMPRDASGTDWVRVVLVPDDDTLNVRAAAGPDQTIVGRLQPGVQVPTTGRTAMVGDAQWLQVTTPAGNGWAHGHYLTTSVADRAALLDQSEAVIDEFATRLANGQDFGDLVSDEGLYVAHHDTPRQFTQSELVGILDDATTYRWGSAAVSSDSPELRPETFTQAIAQQFLSVWRDDQGDEDVTIVHDTVLTGPNGKLAEAVIPTEFTDVPFVAALDPGDNPDYGGLDWQMWVVSMTMEDSSPVILGLTLDNWAP